MKKLLFTLCLALCSTASAETTPLACLSRYTRITEYPILAWCPGGGTANVPGANAAGFNAILGPRNFLPAVQAIPGMKLYIGCQWGPGADSTAGLATALTKDQNIVNLGQNATLAGIMMAHNENVQDKKQQAAWLATNYPQLIALSSANPNPGHYVGSGFPAIGTQNFSLRGECNPGDYCASLDYDRGFANLAGLTFWPLFHAPCSPSKYRFQVNAAAAYGCRASSASSTRRTCPGGRTCSAAAHDANAYIRQVAGPKLWGCRLRGRLPFAGRHAPRQLPSRTRQARGEDGQWPLDRALVA